MHIAFYDTCFFFFLVGISVSDFAAAACLSYTNKLIVRDNEWYPKRELCRLEL
jgi:hypothetical protein